MTVITNQLNEAVRLKQSLNCDKIVLISFIIISPVEIKRVFCFNFAKAAVYSFKLNVLGAVLINV